MNNNMNPKHNYSGIKNDITIDNRMQVQMSIATAHLHSHVHLYASLTLHLLQPNTSLTPNCGTGNSRKLNVQCSRKGSGSPGSENVDPILARANDGEDPSIKW
ncbi:hypothetical protein Scep_010106 [Stephania cephalantha]|uniref:Uncharacterized protein n=1 Tax=Stephania cephalantha TaxID=152367 RepID=A0AAP0PGR8_9MAGN